MLIDACAFAHNEYRRNIENPGNCELNESENPRLSNFVHTK